ncbi:MAG: hypothetical protein LBI14_10390, partial [Treponema sp.]|nr:hypothetical protein [Treponema sp.]
NSTELSEYIIDELIANTVNDRIFTVVDRQQLDAIRAEQNFQFSGEVDDNSAQEIGKILGAQTIISGAIAPLGSGYRLRIRALEVQTAQVLGQFNKNISSSPLIADIIASNSSSGTTTATASTQSTTPASSSTSTPVAPTQPSTQTTSAQSQSSVQTYRIGDTGPSGGLIFYDKGNNSNGWRYLEAAPMEIEFQAPWSVRLGSVLNMVNNTRSDIGSGKQNTQLIVEKLRQVGGEWDSAAIKIVELEFNGFSDWFLPSSGELDQMYGNLKRRNLGDFTDGWYWSSTEYRQGPDLGWGVIVQNFSNSQISVAVIGIITDERSRNHYVRPIRQVPGPN